MRLMLITHVGSSNHENQLQVIFYPLTSSGCNSLAHLILFFTNMSLLVLSCVLCSFLRYRMYDLLKTLYTKCVWKILNPPLKRLSNLQPYMHLRSF